MCLDTVTRVIDYPTDKEVWAWKVFAVIGGKLDFPIHRLNNPPRTGVWLKAKRELSTWILNLDYSPGFHCYRTRQEAKRSFLLDGPGVRVLKVRVRRIYVFGTQDEAKALVARELFIPKESNLTSIRQRRKVGNYD